LVDGASEGKAASEGGLGALPPALDDDELVEVEA
jgi:hypothetical protein